MARSKKGVTTTAEVSIEAAPTMSAADAQALDNDIKAEFIDLGKSVAASYIGLAESLNLMQRTRGYVHLGCIRWEDYLQERIKLARPTIAYLVRLGNSDVDAIREVLKDHPISGSHLLEFARASSKPEAIPELLRAN
ncbi:MAG: hypothetical protein KGR26_10745, partial [Cyanobacteria bacterium REEB65]|nr:hypothetical protein [Cyanobacteria bacterium REEB65]